MSKGRHTAGNETRVHSAGAPTEMQAAPNRAANNDQTRCGRLLTTAAAAASGSHHSERQHLDCTQNSNHPSTFICYKHDSACNQTQPPAAAGGHSAAIVHSRASITNKLQHVQCPTITSAMHPGRACRQPCAAKLRVKDRYGRGCMSGTVFSTCTMTKQREKHEQHPHQANTGARCDTMLTATRLPGQPCPPQAKVLAQLRWPAGAAVAAAAPAQRHPCARRPLPPRWLHHCLQPMVKHPRQAVVPLPLPMLIQVQRSWAWSVLSPRLALLLGVALPQLLTVLRLLAVPLAVLQLRLLAVPLSHEFVLASSPVPLPGALLRVRPQAPS